MNNFFKKILSNFSGSLHFTVTACLFLSFRLGGYEQLPDILHMFPFDFGMAGFYMPQGLQVTKAEKGYLTFPIIDFLLLC